MLWEHETRFPYVNSRIDSYCPPYQCYPEAASQSAHMPLSAPMLPYAFLFRSRSFCPLGPRTTTRTPLFLFLLGWKPESSLNLGLFGKWTQIFSHALALAFARGSLRIALYKGAASTSTLIALAQSKCNYPVSLLRVANEQQYFRGELLCNIAVYGGIHFWIIGALPLLG